MIYDRQDPDMGCMSHICGNENTLEDPLNSLQLSTYEGKVPYRTIVNAPLPSLSPYPLLSSFRGLLHFFRCITCVSDGTIAPRPSCVIGSGADRSRSCSREKKDMGVMICD